MFRPSPSPRRARVLVVGALIAAGAGLLSPATGPAVASADECADGTESDFNGDGRPDAVVGDPRATVSGRSEAGLVTVFYGNGAAVGAGPRASLSQDSPGVSNSAETNDRFGWSLAVADIDCDGYTDLLVGTPYENLGSYVDTGLAQVVFGAPGGLGAGAGSLNLTQSEFGLSRATGDQFGYAVDALEDVGQGGTPAPTAYALAIGVPGRSSGSGLVALRYAYDGGTESQSITQNSPGIPGASEAGDRFGHSIALAQGVGSGDVDAVVGAPYEDLAGHADAGAITILRDIYFEPTGVLVDQDYAGVPGIVESGDRFGEVLDTLVAGQHTELAVGVPRENVGSATDAGAVQLFTFTGGGIFPGAGLDQNTPGVEGASEPGDRFASAVAWATAHPDANNTRLVVGTPGEDSSSADNGMVQSLPLASPSSDVVWSQDSPGVPGTRQAGEHFGAAVAVVTGPGEQVVVVGTPDDVGYDGGMAVAIPVDGATPRLLLPVSATNARTFGASLADAGD